MTRSSGGPRAHRHPLLSFRHARDFFAWFLPESLRGPPWMEAPALLGLCDRYFLLTQIIGRSDLLWHGDPGESVPTGNVCLYERCQEVEANPDDRRGGRS